MSRVGKKPVALPKGVEVKISGSTVSVKGPKGTLTSELFPGVGAAVEGDEVNVTIDNQDKQTRAMFGTTRALIGNMVTGVSEGYTKSLEIQGVGYRAQLQGKKLVLSVGFCHTVDIEAPAGIDFVCPDANHINVTGIDKQLVGQVAANIRAVRKPEPYKGKGIRYVGEQVRRKAGKAGK